MSRTTVLSVYPGQRYEILRVLHNSWGSAPVVWDALFDKYVPKKHEYDHWLISAKDKRLWTLAEDDRLKDYEKAVLVMTYDRAYVSKKDYERAASDIEKFVETYPTRDGSANHWLTIAEIFRSAECPAVGFWMTSVSENPFDGPWNEKAEDYDPPDWTTYFSVYDELNAVTPPLPPAASPESVQPTESATRHDTQHTEEGGRK